MCVFFFSLHIAASISKNKQAQIFAILVGYGNSIARKGVKLDPFILYTIKYIARLCFWAHTEKHQKQEQNKHKKLVKFRTIFLVSDQQCMHIKLYLQEFVFQLRRCCRICKIQL